LSWIGLDVNKHLWTDDLLTGCSRSVYSNGGDR